MFRDDRGFEGKSRSCYYVVTRGRNGSKKLWPKTSLRSDVHPIGIKDQLKSLIIMTDIQKQTEQRGSVTLKQTL